MDLEISLAMKTHSIMYQLILIIGYRLSGYLPRPYFTRVRFFIYSLTDRTAINTNNDDEKDEIHIPEDVSAFCDFCRKLAEVRIDNVNYCDEHLSEYLEKTKSLLIKRAWVYDGAGWKYQSTTRAKIGKTISPVEYKHSLEHAKKIKRDKFRERDKRSKKSAKERGGQQTNLGDFQNE